MTSTVRTAKRVSRRAALLLLLQTLAACSATPRMSSSPPATSTPQAVAPVAEITPEGTPAETPLWPQIDAQSYRLQVTGLVASPLSLTYETLRILPRVPVERVLMCSGEFFHDKAIWSGVPLDCLLALAEPQPAATAVTLFTTDNNKWEVPIVEASSYILAHEREGEPLAEKRGFPLRIVPATDEGWKWLKWVVEIRVA
jgi:DMSO/TMAO reductase YedYZ molybdopterin-dependent catalytic subunit